jgi:hypothetical protein
MFLDSLTPCPVAVFQEKEHGFGSSNMSQPPAMSLLPAGFLGSVRILLATNPEELLNDVAVAKHDGGNVR